MLIINSPVVKYLLIWTIIFNFQFNPNIWRRLQWLSTFKINYVKWTRNPKKLVWKKLVRWNWHSGSWNLIQVWMLFMQSVKSPPEEFMLKVHAYVSKFEASFLSRHQKIKSKQKRLMCKSFLNISKPCLIMYM